MSLEQFTREEVNAIRRLLEATRRSLNISAVLLRIMQSEALGARCYRSTTQSLPDTTWTSLSWDAPVHDTNDFWDASNPTQFIAKTRGYYMAGGGMAWGEAGAGVYRAYMRIVAENTELARTTILTGAAITYQMDISSGMFWMEEGDAVVVQGYQDSGISKTINAATSTLHPPNHGWIARVA